MSDDAEPKPLRLKRRSPADATPPSDDKAESAGPAESESTEPARLRLRPRSGDDAKPAPTAPEPEAQVESEPEAEKPKLRLRPKLFIDEPSALAQAEAAAPEPEPEPTAPPPEVVSSPVPAAEAPPAPPPAREPPPPATPEMPGGKFRLKFTPAPAGGESGSVPGAPSPSDSSAASSNNPTPPPPVEGNAKPPFPVAPLAETPSKLTKSRFSLKPGASKDLPPVAVANAKPEPIRATPPPPGQKNQQKADDSSSGTMPPLPGKLIHIKAKPSATEANLTAKPAKPVKAKVKKSRSLTTLTVLLFLLMAVYVGYRFFFIGDNAPPAAVAAMEDSLAKTAEKAKSLPGQLVDKAQESVMSRRDSEQSRVDAVLEGREPEAGPMGMPTPEELDEKMASPAELNPAPVVGAGAIGNVVPEDVRPGESRSPVVETTIEASAEFQAFVARIQVNGVFQGSPARALMDGRTVREGELIDAGLRIRFSGVDSPNKYLLFTDDTGAVVAKKY